MKRETIVSITNLVTESLKSSALSAEVFKAHMERKSCTTYAALQYTVDDLWTAYAHLLNKYQKELEDSL